MQTTCKSCIHCSVCDYWEKEAYPDVADSDKTYDVICKYFKPIADIEEVRRGEWVDKETCYMCSLCGRVERLKEPYCHCGAKMTEEK